MDLSEGPGLWGREAADRFMEKRAWRASPSWQFRATVRNNRTKYLICLQNIALFAITALPEGRVDTTNYPQPRYGVTNATHIMRLPSISEFRRILRTAPDSDAFLREVDSTMEISREFMQGMQIQHMANMVQVFRQTYDPDFNLVQVFDQMVSAFGHTQYNLIKQIHATLQRGNIEMNIATAFPWTHMCYAQSVTMLGEPIQWQAWFTARLGLARVEMDLSSPIEFEDTLNLQNEIPPIGAVQYLSGDGETRLREMKSCVQVFIPPPGNVGIIDIAQTFYIELMLRKHWWNNVFTALQRPGIPVVPFYAGYLLINSRYNGIMFTGSGPQIPEDSLNSALASMKMVAFNVYEMGGLFTPETDPENDSQGDISHINRFPEQVLGMRPQPRADWVRGFPL